VVPTLPLVVRVALWRLRRGLPLVVVVAVGLLVAGRIAPTAEPTEPVVVTAREVPAGGALAERDLRLARVPTRLVPDGAQSDPGSLTGQEVLITLPRGVPVVRSMLADGRFGRAAPPGTVTVPVRVDAVVARLLRPGDQIDLVAPADLSPVVLARGALVLDVVTGETSATPWSGSVGEDPVTVVAVSPDEGHRLAGAGWDSLGAVLVAGS
jgi:pilus assembly protein CpaB